MGLLFLGSWFGQAFTMQETINEQGWTEFSAATFENWQSEFLQLAVQGILLLGMKHKLFKVDAEDLEEIKDKLDKIHSLQQRNN